MSQRRQRIERWSSLCLYFWPLIILAGRLAVRAILNVWNMMES